MGLSREQAEKAADEVFALAEEFRAKHPQWFMTETQRVARGLPDVSDLLRERLIESLMKDDEDE